MQFMMPLADGMPQLQQPLMQGMKFSSRQLGAVDPEAANRGYCC
jgi:hypothetical protein